MDSSRLSFRDKLYERTPQFKNTLVLLNAGKKLSVFGKNKPDTWIISTNTCDLKCLQTHWCTNLTQTGLQIVFEHSCDWRVTLFLVNFSCFCMFSYRYTLMKYWSHNHMGHPKVCLQYIFEILPSVGWLQADERNHSCKHSQNESPPETLGLNLCCIALCSMRLQNELSASAVFVDVKPQSFDALRLLYGSFIEQWMADIDSDHHMEGLSCIFSSSLLMIHRSLQVRFNKIKDKEEQMDQREQKITGLYLNLVTT